MTEKEKTTVQYSQWAPGSYINSVNPHFPQQIWVDLAEGNPDNSFKFYYSKEGLKCPFSFMSLSTKFHAMYEVKDDFTTTSD